MTSLCIFALALSIAPSQGGVPEHFHSQLRCPFASVWLEHGADRAAQMLGLDTPHRRLSEKVVFGTCSYTNSFANTDSCVEFVGSSWTPDSAKERCDNIMMGTVGTLVEAGTCTRTDQFAGWCSTAEGTEMALLEMGGMSADCEAVGSACVTWSNGVFVGEGACAEGADSGAGDSGPSPAPPPMQPTPGEEEACAIAPGPIGAAHMHGFSAGYSTDCVGSPAQQSPYMWPLRWSAHVKSEGLSFGSDKVTYTSKGKVMYMTDKNWKRLDLWYQSGVQFTVGQSPCENPDSNDTLRCNRDSEKNTTILHRGSRMSFIDYHENGSISDCTWMDLSYIGNVRPDWYMDKRGSATDVQYLGDVHLYYEGEPKLVKQWRKKDFANQYFTMSMQGNPGDDGIHWPLTLNVPGEGFGDDFLQSYSNHALVTEDDTEAFLIDDAFVAAGGSCPKVGGGETSGPPVGEVEHVPSNLEVDLAAWRSIEYTLSPVVEYVKAAEPCTSEVSSGNGMMRLTDEIYVQGCWDSDSSALSVMLRAKMERIAWSAMSFRESSECLMTPRGGGDQESILALPARTGDAYSVHFGPLSPAMKRFEDAAIANYVEQMTPIEEMDGMGGSAAFVNGELQFSFARKYESKPDSFYLNYALGNGKTVDYHKTRGCFELKDVPMCMGSAQVPDASDMSGGRRLMEQVPSAGAMLTAFSMGSLLR
eukprot:CAMPEP_0197666050 /NCGR_PEP_ID=MMETSP1338-20131121/61372_1 /TAXON_ID=43686 ORGANISM="Pelagodinium beii, Strain RCC1491" /NCGR_SAMPLE_ID=MMETSP1338 /ASSEMBLY_ACC=CAM_ASM_000754 /LENGTH=700 /DNA_ID=CAMNT_0043245017 /DNA_START=29 /DNA_END=2131 /DNA_ORIENTATION=+